MEAPTITQLTELHHNDPFSMVFGDLIIVSLNPLEGTFEIYSRDAQDSSDPDPIFTGTEQEVIQYFKDLN